jgi:8-oxo-dGTP diphosphatase
MIQKMSHGSKVDRDGGGVVEWIHVGGSAGGSLRSLNEVRVMARVGLAGDRYAARQGYWADNKVSRDVTLIEAEMVEEVATELGVPIEPGLTRRNLTTRGIRLNELVEQGFWVGDVLCFGTSLCEPCRHLEELTGLQLVRPLVHRGGLRADALTSGRVRVGDRVRPADTRAGVGVVVVRDGRILMGRRLAAHGRGTWSTPGGAPETGEAAVECALRELEEETGLTATSAREIGSSVVGFVRSGLVFRTRFVEVTTVAGRPDAREPEKTAAWEWRDWSDLPQPLFPPVASLVASGYRPPPA